MKLSRILAFVLLGLATARAAEQEPLTAPGAYRFLGGERIRLILVPDASNTALEQLVSDDGFIALPTGGEPLNIKGKTIVEAQKAAAEQILKDSPGKRVSTALALLAVPPRSVYVGGEGIKTGVAIPLGNGTPLTLYAAILSAGGTTSEGDLSRVTVTHTQFDGKIDTTTFDASKYGDKNNKSLGPILEAGDVVKVPKSEVVLLAGEVNKAGPLSMRELSQAFHSIRASKAIYATGGLKPNANRKQIKILRSLPNGSTRVLNVDLDSAEKSTEGAETRTQSDAHSSPDSDPELKDGDVIVATQGGGIPVLGKVRLPGVYPLNGQFVKLSRVLALAGGFADFAKTSDITIIKANGMTTHANLSNPQKNGLQDVDLEDGDLVFVGERLL